MINYTAGTVLAKKVNAQNNFVEEELDCSDINAVAITGTQTISGNKIFSSDITTSGNFVLASVGTGLKTNTTSGSDTSYTTVMGAGTINTNRGAEMKVFGNQHVSFPGYAQLTCGNISTAKTQIKTIGNQPIELITNELLRWSIDSGGNLIQGITGGNVLFNLSNAYIRQSTSDGSDNKAIYICGGGDSTSDRGSSLSLFGNDHDSNAGKAYLFCGNVTDSAIVLRTLGSQTIQFHTYGLQRWYISSSGHIIQNPTNGDDIVFSRTNGNVRQVTLDGSDTNSISIAGGGSALTTRGAFITAHGNESPTNSGNLYLYCGAVGGAAIKNVTLSNQNIEFYTNAAKRWYFDGTSPYGLGGTSSVNYIGTDTVDGSDNKAIYICGGGFSTSSARGGGIEIYGNECVGGNAGIVRLTGGGVTSGHVAIITNGSDAFIQLSPYNPSGAGQVRFYPNGSIVYSNTNAGYCADTADGSDTKSFCIAGGGALSDVSRGAYITVRGNENASSGGTISIAGGDVSGGHINLTTQQTNANIILSPYNPGGDRKVTFMGSDGSMVYTYAAFAIHADTSDAADTKSLQLCGGGDSGSTRGAYITLAGNENASTGRIDYVAGNVTGGVHNFYTSGNLRWTINAAGNLIPASALSIGSSGTTTAISEEYFTNGTAIGAIKYGLSANSIGFGSLTNHGVLIYDNNTPILYIDTSGIMPYGSPSSLVCGTTGNPWAGANFSDGTANGSLKFTSNIFQVGTRNAYSLGFISNNLTRWLVDSSGNLLQDSTNGGDLVFTKTSGNIRSNTSDGSDNKGIYITGGGSGAVSRGATLFVYGNEHTTYSGLAQLESGDSSNANLILRCASSTGSIQFKTGGSNLRWIIDSNGHYLPQTDNSLDIGSPSYRVRDIYTGNAVTVSGSPGIKISRDSNFGYIDSTGDNDLEIRRNNVSRLMFTSSGTTVRGDLNVSGTLNYINTETLLVEDNNIVLNSTWSGSPTENASIIVERGSSNDAQILWNESSDQWEAGISGALNKILTQTDLNSISGYIDSRDTAISGAVTSGYQAADTAYSGYAEGAFVNVSGDTMTGFLILNADPTASGHAATKQYVDAQISSGLSIGTIDSVTKSSNAAVISGGKLYLQTADAIYPGAISTGTQTIVGAKTFSNTLSINTASGVSAISVRVNSAGGFNVDTAGNINIVGSLFTPTCRSFGVDFYTGTSTNNSMFFVISGVYGWYMDTFRNLIQEATYGGNIILNKETANYALYLDASKQIKSESALAASRGGTGLAGSTGYRVLYGNNSGGWITNSAFTFNGTNLAMPGGGAVDFAWSTGTIKCNSSDSHRILIDANSNAITLYENGTIYFNIGTSPGTTQGYFNSSGFHCENIDCSKVINLNGAQANLQIGQTTGKETRIWGAGRVTLGVGVATIEYSTNNLQPDADQSANLGASGRKWNGLNVYQIGIPSTANNAAVMYSDSYQTFTGHHLYQFEDSLSPGDAVRLENNKIVKCNTENDSRCLGIFEKTMTFSGIDYILLDSLRQEVITPAVLAAVAAVGDNRNSDSMGFKVCDEGGPISAGTLLTTASGYPGYLKAQDDDIIRSYTVGKSLEDVTFSGGIANNIYGVICCG